MFAVVIEAFYLFSVFVFVVGGCVAEFYYFALVCLYIFLSSLLRGWWGWGEYLLLLLMFCFQFVFLFYFSKLDPFSHHKKRSLCQTDLI